MDTNNDPSISRKTFLAQTAAIIGTGVAGMTAGLPSAQAQTGRMPRFRILGGTKLSVSVIGYGTTESESPSVLKRAIESGINFIDTGRMYANGRNEEMIGKVTEGARQELVIQTKFHRQHVNDAAAIERSVEESLRALRTDYIDILLLHAASSVDQIRSPAVRDAFARLIEKGAIRFTGFSSHTNQAEMLNAAIETNIYDIAMVAYNHAGQFDHTVYRGFHQEWDQRALEEEMERATGIGMGIVAMKTCSAGPYRESGASSASFPAGLRRVLMNRNISAMAVWIGNFRQLEEDVAIME